MPRLLSVNEFEAAYPDEEACHDALVRARWPNGYRCARCGGQEATFLRRRRLFQCHACRYQSSVLAGTILQDTKLPLRTWFWALFFYATTKKSLSACELQRKLGLSTYRAAWLLHRKLQAVLATNPRTLRGLVEIDETYVGAVTPGKTGRGTRKAIVALTVEERGTRAGSLASRHVQDFSHDSLAGLLHDRVEHGSIVKTDGLPSYFGLDEEGYQHARQVEGDPRRAPIILPRVHVAAGNLKRVLDGVHAGRVSRKHLHAYLAEFDFRHNHRGFLEQAFGIALRATALTPPSTYRMVVC